jgi:alpha,alpha-trehalose phosphorylase
MSTASRRVLRSLIVTFPSRAMTGDWRRHTLYVPGRSQHGQGASRAEAHPASGDPLVVPSLTPSATLMSMTGNGFDWTRFKAVLFDLDGVVTSTARLHAAAWKKTFDSFLAVVAPGQEPFDPVDEYRRHVDGLPRYDGVAGFLASRGLDLPWGQPDDEPGYDSVCALGNAKNAEFTGLLAASGADAFPDAVALLDHLDEVGIPVALVTSSANRRAILESVGLSNRFKVNIDGVVAIELGFEGKPAPDAFLEAARRLGVDPTACAVLEDAVSGVLAGKAGGFGYVIGVDRHGSPADLIEAGADVAISDLTDLIIGARGWPGYPFTPEPWALTRDGLVADLLGVDETLFAQGNGNLGVRAAFAQGAPVREPGTLLNGFYEAWPIVYPEPAYGLASEGQTILYVPEATRLSVRWNGMLLDLNTARLRRRLDFRTGILTDTAEWPELTATWERLVSLRHNDVMAQRVVVETREEGDLEVQTRVINRLDVERTGRDIQLFEPGEKVDPRLAPAFGRRVLQPGDRFTSEGSCVLTYRTTSSNLPLAVAGRVDCSMATTGWSIPDGDRAVLNATEHATAGSRHTAEVVVAYRRDDNAHAAGEYLAALGGFEMLAKDQAADLADLWAHSDIEIEGDPVAQQAVRFAILQLHWASASLEGHGVPARGLTGRSYEGHHFWDSDVFLMPFLSAANPRAAREIVAYRHGMLPKARKRAATLSVNGALYPWRTITGDEASAFFEGSTAQFHIDADVIRGLRSYVDWTADADTLWDMGVEMAVETARMWASLGFWDGNDFHIHGVTGPDEYTALVNDNAYTNQMARMNLRFAASLVERMRTEQADRFHRLSERLGLLDPEIDDWRRVAESLVILRDDELGVTAQDATFLSLEPWDWDTPLDKYPLLLHFHPLVIYRHRVLKQADVVMAHFLLPEDTPWEQQQADFDFYDPLTTGDSSLSPAIQSAVAARVGRPLAAWEYFREAAMLDLADRAGSTASGIHLACAAGVWLAVVRGFVGLNLTDGEVVTDPALPAGWDSVTVNVQVQGRPIRVVARRE